MLDYIVLSPVGNSKGYIIDDFIEHVKNFDPPPKEIAICLAVDHGFDLTRFKDCVIKYSSKIAAKDGSLERICDSREILRKHFIYHQKQPEYALWIDTDVLCPPETPSTLYEVITEKNRLIAVNKTMSRRGHRLLCGSGVMLTHRHACTASRFWVGNIYDKNGVEKHLSEDFVFFAIFDQGKRLLENWTGRSGRVCGEFVKTEHIQRQKRLPKKLPETPWLFILGCNNSGTSLLQHLLRLHPQIDHLPNEGQGYMLSTRGVEEVTGKNFHRVFTEALEYMNPPRDYDRQRPSVDVPLDPDILRRRWLGARKGRDGSYCMVKSPPDMVRTHWLQHHFNPCRFIAIVRNGYSTTVSIMRSGKSTERAATHWNLANKIMLRDSAQLKHFHLIKYEDLVEDTEKTIRELEQFLELDPMDCSFLSNYNVKRRFFFPGLREGKILNKNKAPRRTLSQEKIDVITGCANEMLSHFDYVPPEELMEKRR